MSLSHLLTMSQSDDEVIVLCLEYNVLSTDQTLNQHNFATAQPIVK